MNIEPSLCPACSEKNDCNLAENKPIETCWCMAMPTVLAVPETDEAPASCYCRECFQKVFR